MPFKLLKQVIAHLRKQIKCPNCKSGINETSIFVIATSQISDKGSFAGLFQIACPKCSGQAFVLTEAASITALRIHSKMAGGKISANDILDMHNFLKDWQGNVKELFYE